jgi:hypothetical protein
VDNIDLLKKARADCDAAVAAAEARNQQMSAQRQTALLSDDAKALDKLDAETDQLQKAASRQRERAALLDQQIAAASEHAAALRLDKVVQHAQGLSLALDRALDAYAKNAAAIASSLAEITALDAAVDRINDRLTEGGRGNARVKGSRDKRRWQSPVDSPELREQRYVYVGPTVIGPGSWRNPNDVFPFGKEVLDQSDNRDHWELRPVVVQHAQLKPGANKPPIHAVAKIPADDLGPDLWTESTRANAARVAELTHVPGVDPPARASSPLADPAERPAVPVPLEQKPLAAEPLSPLAQSARRLAGTDGRGVELCPRPHSAGEDFTIGTKIVD